MNYCFLSSFAFKRSSALFQSTSSAADAGRLRLRPPIVVSIQNWISERPTDQLNRFALLDMLIGGRWGIKTHHGFGEFVVSY